MDIIELYIRRTADGTVECIMEDTQKGKTGPVKRGITDTVVKVTNGRTVQRRLLTMQFGTLQTRQ